MILKEKYEKVQNNNNIIEIQNKTINNNNTGSAKNEIKDDKKYISKKLLKDIEDLNEKINKFKEKEKNSVDLSEIRKQFKYINDIIQRLQLTMETFCINLKCKSCYKIKIKMFQLSCGHSICDECIKNEKIFFGGNLNKSDKKLKNKKLSFFINNANNDKKR